jgi:CheY-like chemotaxis protein
MEATPAAPGAKKILVIDDNQIVLRAMMFMLSAKGYAVLLAETGAEAIHALLGDAPAGKVT